MKPGGSRLVGWLLLASLLFLAAAGLVFLYTQNDDPPPPGAGASQETGSNSDDKKKKKGKKAKRRAPQLEIPSIGVDTKVISLEKNADGTLETPTDYDEAGWWAGGPMPGEHGAAVVTGHVDSAETGPAVFYRLSELAPGDEVEFTNRRGKKLRFEVESTERYPKDAFPTLKVYGRTPGPRLRLVTCTGAFDAGSGHYRDNLIVYARPA